jgi:hypothetical protein
MTLFQKMGNDLEQTAPPPQFIPEAAPQIIRTFPPASFPPPRRREPAVSWVPSLLIACLTLGIMAQMVRVLAVKIKDEQVRASEYQTGLGITEGFQEEIGKLVADPKTLTFTLLGADKSPVHRAVAMWNVTRQAGMLFCDQLPILSDNRQYEIWATAKDGTSSKVGQFIAKPGISVYFYDAPFTGEPVNIEVTAGHRDAGNPPILANASALHSNSVGG